MNNLNASFDTLIDLFAFGACVINTIYDIHDMHALMFVSQYQYGCQKKC